MNFLIHRIVHLHQLRKLQGLVWDRRLRTLHPHREQCRRLLPSGEVVEVTAQLPHLGCLVATLRRLAHHQMIPPVCVASSTRE
jgi:hypothetical protein